MITHTIQLLEHNALYRDDMDAFEYDFWEREHLKIMNKQSLIGL